jgi:hypothetical protein
VQAAARTTDAAQDVIFGVGVRMPG